MKPFVLIAEDDDTMRFLLEELFSRNGYDTLSAANGEDAVLNYDADKVDVVLLDIKMPRLNGLEVLEAIRSRDEDAVVIMLTAFATIKTAVEAMRKGAFDYVTKPFQTEELALVVAKAVEHRQLIKENRNLKRVIGSMACGECSAEISDIMREIYEKIALVAPSDHPVLLEGESGTGKSLMARVIHERSRRANGPFVRVNCANLPANLIESELYGYEKGAFTGAVKEKPGKVELADGGTLFLDEISTLDLSSQASLLQLIQDHEFERVGGTRPRQVDVRIIAASNQDLRSLIRKKQFREDLFFRLNVFDIVIPPLRERREDILPLAASIIHRLSGREDISLSLEAAARLREYDWPGNIRQLENVLKHALILLGEGTTIGCVHFPAELCPEPRLPKKGRHSLKEMLRQTEKQIIEETLATNNMDIDRAAQSLGIARRSLYYRMSKLGITRSGDKSKP